MRKMTFIGWTVFHRYSRTEWPAHGCVRSTRRDAIAAWKLGLRPELADELFKARIADGSIRVGKVMVQALEGGEG